MHCVLLLRAQLAETYRETASATIATARRSTGAGSSGNTPRRGLSRSRACRCTDCTAPQCSPRSLPRVLQVRPVPGRSYAAQLAPHWEAALPRGLSTLALLGSSVWHGQNQLPPRHSHRREPALSAILVLSGNQGCNRAILPAVLSHQAHTTQWSRFGCFHEKVE